MNERLYGIDLKLDRAQEHLENIDEDAATWIAKQETWDFPHKVNQGERRYVVSLRLVKPPPPSIPIIGDEIIHHLRSSLDHLACYLVERSGSKDVSRTVWPIMDSPWKWAREVERRKRPRQFWRKKGSGALAGSTPAVRAFIEGKQPYKGGGETRDDPLLGLHELWNTEKHRILNPITVYATPHVSWRSLFTVTPDVEPADFRWVIKPRDVLELGTPRTLAVLEFAKGRRLPKVEMNGEIPAQVMIGDGERNGRSLQEDLDLIRGIVSEAKALFPPST